jgi:hypothetical protein
LDSWHLDGVTLSEVSFAPMNRHRLFDPSGPKSADFVAKGFWGLERKFLEPLMRFTRGDMRGPHRFIQNRPRTSVVAPKGSAAAERSKNQLSRDFQGCSIFDFCNKICQKQTQVTAQVEV